MMNKASMLTHKHVIVHSKDGLNCIHYDIVMEFYEYLVYYSLLCFSRPNWTPAGGKHIIKLPFGVRCTMSTEATKLFICKLFRTLWFDFLVNCLFFLTVNNMNISQDNNNKHTTLA